MQRLKNQPTGKAASFNPQVSSQFPVALVKPVPDEDRAVLGSSQVKMCDGSSVKQK